MISGDIIRQKSSTDGTPGVMILADGWTCKTLELPWVNNERGRSCIVADTYRAKLWESPHLGSPSHRPITRKDGSDFDLWHKVYRLEDKHGRLDCLLHNANFAGEVQVGLETQLHGCTALGYGYGAINNHAGLPQFAILKSVMALEALIEHTQGEELELQYHWDDGCAPEGL